MPKHNSNHETLLLTLELLKRIPSPPRRVGAPDLHKQLEDIGIECSKRTVERQLKMLYEEGFIDRDERSKPYGYHRLRDANSLSVPSLNEQESMLLLLAEGHLKNLLPADVLKCMKVFFDQARINIHNQHDKKLEKQWLKKVRVVSQTQPLIPAQIKPGILEEVSNALYKNLWLNIEYENASAYRSESRVMPLGLAQQGPNLYLVVRYEGYDNERSLALHRFISAKASTFTFTRPKEFDLKTYDADGRFGFGEGKRIQLSFRIAKDAGAHLLETPLSEDQQVKEFDDEYQIKATVVDTEQLKWWLRGFGDDVRAVRRKAIV